MNIRQSRRLFVPLAIVIALVGSLAYGMLAAPKGATSNPTPAPGGKQVATFAAGCFWSMEAIFKQLKGVESVEPGYAGGKAAYPSYEQVENGDTGYAESINIIFDPKVISYRDLLQVLLVARNPTTLNAQGPDEGTQYRSAIFTRNAEQQRIAKQAVQEVNASHTWSSPIVTTITPYTTFYRAEAYHWDYYRLHPYQPYCATVIAPEIAEFRAKFKSKLKA